MAVGCTVRPTRRQAGTALRPALIVHGGAGVRPVELRAAQRAGCAAALAAGWRVLDLGGSALDAVCAAVAAMEDDPVFNAGVGSCLTSGGTVEMDASVMEGEALRAGAVAVVRAVCNPVRLARAVLDEGRVVMLAGTETETFARAHGVPTCQPGALVTERQWQQWRQHGDGGTPGTVGAAAVDRAGHVAAATSTGGLSYKCPGRVGDSAVIGAGTYADDGCGAASATGHGEAIIRVALAKSVVASLRDGRDPSLAARQGIVTLERRLAGAGGIIVVDGLGRLGHAYNTPHMTVGFARSGLPGHVVHM
jgi:beta-aspartyl-peptidase (threonine type)